jgi:hypothetical protein
MWKQGLTWVIAIIIALGIIGTFVLIPQRIQADVTEQVSVAVETALAIEVAKSKKEIQDALDEVNSAEKRALESAILAEEYAGDAKNYRDELLQIVSGFMGEVGEYTVVISNSTDLEDSFSQVDKAKELGFDSAVYRIQDLYVTTVGQYPTESAQLDALNLIRELIMPNAYGLNLSVSCPFHKLHNQGYFMCSLQPFE